MNVDIKALFLEETQTQLKDWEDALLVLEKHPDDAGQLHKLLRALHTLKGSAGFVDCGELQTLTHLLESIIIGDRDEEPRLEPGLTGLLFDGLDGTRAIIEAFSHDRPTRDAARGITTMLEGLLAEKASSEGGSNAPAQGRLFRIGIHIEAPPSERYLRALLAQTRLEEIGTIVAVNPTLEELRMQDAEFDYGVVIETLMGEEDLARALSIDQVKVLQIRTHGRGESAADGGTAGPGARGDASQAEAEEGASRHENVVRVPASKLDSMLNLVGELVVENSGFMSLARELKDIHKGSPIVGRLEKKTERLSRIARQLQDAVMKVRMLPAATVFSRFPRVVRDLSKSTSKEIRLLVSGGETEIDKKVIDRMSEPLVHLVRNAADHGLECAADRRAVGKEPVGLIRLSAYQEGDHICVEVSDDGRGLDRQRIVAKAMEKGLVRQEDAQELSDEAVSGLIFLPGFSTAETVSDISGRGVGLDVVKRFVEEMDGSLRVRTVPGRSTTITITLPLTMAIIRALLVENSSLLYAIPISAVSEVVTVTPELCTQVRGDTVIQLRQETLPVLPLEDLLDTGSPDDLSLQATRVAAGVVVMVRHAGRRVGLGVTRVLGSAEVVIKSLGRHFREVEGLLGASILGNGRMAIILDVGVLLEMRFAGGLGEHPSFLEPLIAATDRMSTGPTAEASPVAEAPPTAEASPVAEAPRVAGTPLEEIFSESAVAASHSLSTLLKDQVRVTFPELLFVPLAEVAARLGGEDRPVVRVYVDLKEGILGGHLVIIPMDQALRLCDALLGREPATTVQIGEEELSTFSELGNILSATFLNSIADRLGISINSEVPDVRVDMCLSAIDSILARFHEPGSDILLTTTEVLAGSSDEAVCHMLLFLERPSLALLQDSLGG